MMRLIFMTTLGVSKKGILDLECSSSLDETMAMAAVAVPTTATMTLMDLPGTAYRLKKSRLLFLSSKTSVGPFVISEKNTGVFDHDQELSALFTGFLSAFVDQFEFLKRNSAQLAPSLSAELEKFDILLERRPQYMASLDSDAVKTALTKKLDAWKSPETTTVTYCEMETA